MTCKDCHDTRIYQPFNGPSEPCLACAGGIRRDVLIPMDKLIIEKSIDPYEINDTMLALMGLESIPFEIKIDRDLKVTQGVVIVLALIWMKTYHFEDYNRLLQGDLIPGTMAPEDYDEAMRKIKEGR